MEEETIRERLERLEIPDPDPASRGKALAAAKEEFRRRQQEKKSKGFLIIGRLMDKIQKGGSAMRRSYAVSAGVAAVLVTMLVVVILPNLQSYRTGVSTPKRQAFPLRESAPDATDPLPAKGEAGVPADTLMTMQEMAPQPELSARTAQEALMRARKEVEIPQLYAFAKGKAGDRKRPLAGDSSGIPPLDQTYVGRDRFETIEPNRMKLASEEPVSTFSIDVDTASYAFVRRALNSGVLPQKDAVRVEELINYFHYDYPLPASPKAPFRPTVAIFPTPWNPDTKLLHIGIRGYEIASGKKPRANLVLLVDVSGSMDQPDKLPLLKNAFRMLVETLAAEDTVAIVVYAGAAGTVLEPTEASEKGKILAALDQLNAGGSTAGGEGIRRAYALAEMNYDPDSVNRVILATDGDFNVGIRNPEELKGFVERKRETGIYLSVLGFGQGNYHDALMQALAQNGNGNAAYIDNLNEARKVLVDEVQSTLFTIAKDVKIQIEFNPATIAEYRLIGYETRLLQRDDFNNDRVDAGDVGAGHRVTAIYEIVPAGSKARLIDDLRYADQASATKPTDGKQQEEYAFLKIRYKRLDSDTSKLMTTPIGTDVESSTTGKAPMEARFAASVAAFGQLLRGDAFTGSFTYDDVLSLAEPARGRDRFGYRTEFLNLVRLAKTARAMGDR